MLKKRKEEKRCQSNLSFAITKQAIRNTSHACTQKSFSLKFQPKIKYRMDEEITKCQIELMQDKRK
jgi:hypothetical protein